VPIQRDTCGEVQSGIVWDRFLVQPSRGVGLGGLFDWGWRDAGERDWFSEVAAEGNSKFYWGQVCDAWARRHQLYDLLKKSEDFVQSLGPEGGVRVFASRGS
jgi:hypothetical protein